MSVPKNQVVPEAERVAFELRQAGCAYPGYVDLRHFDEGIVRTLDARIYDAKGQVVPSTNKIVDGEYFVNIQNVAPPPGKPGIPITFAYPEDIYRKHILPAFVVRRDDISAAMQRWQSLRTVYNVPAEGSLPVSVVVPDGSTKSGFDAYQIALQAEPMDFLYTISILGRHREGLTGSLETNEMLRYVLSRFNAYGPLQVYDSVGDMRVYEVFREGIANLDDLPEVTGRVIGFAVTLRVEGEWDIIAPRVYRSARKFPQIGSTAKIGFKEG